ncbi:Hypothetical protein NTJ_11428 [Nesidiocoris tenuis]|uniref:Uncharacterized protein n=1 Tax=Nesidiocoris tenuis TaxID=355587 RepID=A0ABN7B761_9HEMI|nr:Hypothetical protein NTJ_11428 [Nesidiocoris tenuis]
MKAGCRKDSGRSVPEHGGSHFQGQIAADLPLAQNMRHMPWDPSAVERIPEDRVMVCIWTDSGLMDSQDCICRIVAVESAWSDCSRSSPGPENEAYALGSSSC